MEKNEIEPKIKTNNDLVFEIANSLTEWGNWTKSDMVNAINGDARESESKQLLKMRTKGQLLAQLVMERHYDSSEEASNAKN